jgi:hypothetical protein
MMFLFIGGESYREQTYDVEAVLIVVGCVGADERCCLGHFGEA